MDRAAHLSVWDRILFNAVAAMLDLTDPPDMDEAGWVRAEHMLAAYTAAVEARR